MAPGKHSGQRAAFCVVHFGCFKVPQIKTAERCGQILALPQKQDPETDRISSPGHGVIFAGPCLLMLGDLSLGADLPSFLELIRWPPDTEDLSPKMCPIPDRFQ